jgi:hypothetical protein
MLIVEPGPHLRSTPSRDGEIAARDGVMEKNPMPDGSRLAASSFPCRCCPARRADDYTESTDIDA